MRDLWIFQFYRSCLTLRIHLFDFINVNKDSRLINSNLLQRSKISVLEDNEVRNEEDSTSFKTTSRYIVIARMVNKQPSEF